MRIQSLLTTLAFKCEVLFSMIKKIQTEIGLLDNMSTQMEVDDDAIATTLSRTSCVEPVLRISPFVEKERKLCITCFSGAMKKNTKRANLQKITDINSNQQRALLWTNGLFI